MLATSTVRKFPATFRPEKPLAAKIVYPWTRVNKPSMTLTPRTTTGRKTAAVTPTGKMIILKQHEWKANQQSNLIQDPETEARFQAIKQSLINGELNHEDYLESDHFTFKETTTTNPRERLKRAMNLIYPRKRPLVAIDIEYYEGGPDGDQGAITEMGIAVLDPQEQIHRPCLIYHLVIKETLSLRNQVFVDDNKDNPMNGESFVIARDDAVSVVTKLLDKYITQRDGVLVGHNFTADLKKLRGLGVTIPSKTDVVDTLMVHRISRKRGGNLWRMLRSLGIPYANLHNAANDAYHTLLVALNYCDPIVRLSRNLDHYCEEDVLALEANYKTVNVVHVDDVDQLMKDLQL